MNVKKKSYDIGKFLLVAGLLFSITVFGYRVYSHYYQMPIDYLIFLKSGRDFQDSGKLYQRAENYTEKYGPSAAIYKFPPPFQLAFVPLAKLPREVNQLAFIKPLLIGMYMLSIWLIYRLAARELTLSDEQRFYFSSFLTIISAWFMPFFESIRWLLAEIPILLILITSFMLAQKGRMASVMSGMLIAFVSCIKIYPAFMAGNMFREKNYAGLTGIVVGGVITLLASIHFFGIEEHIFYFQQILPILLNEDITTKWINLNIEKFLYSTGIISEANGTIFSISRVIFISIFLGMLIKYRNTLTNHAFLVFSFFITTMFFCFPNYWPQYQIYLVIPVAYLIASYLKVGAKPGWTLALGLATMVMFVPDDLWKNPLILKAPILSSVSLLLYETRSLATVCLWLLLAREIHITKNS